MEHKKGEPHMDKRGNIFSRNMRLFAAIMTLIEALVLTSFTGCAGKKVDLWCGHGGKGAKERF